MRQPARTFQDLIVWQKAHGFVLSVYKFTELFPKSEIYGLTSQFRRAAISIAANIAEGFKKKGMCRQSAVYEYCTIFLGRMPLLSNS
jgi:four helix bundle protein